MAKKKMSVRQMKAEVTRLEKEITVAAQQDALKGIVGSPEFRIVYKKFVKLGLSPQVIAKLFATTGKSGGTVTKARAKVPAKYKHPDNPKLLWSGRGRKPKWVEECVVKGIALEDLLIKK